MKKKKKQLSKECLVQKLVQLGFMPSLKVRNLIFCLNR